ncbi:MAG: histidine kinase, partial [Acidobacteria bacterium]|nr:histidine kinase [Acidobacteriota bacterium]
VADTNAAALAEKVREAGLDVPVVLLARDREELADFQLRHGLGGLERAFLWQGDARILLGIVKSVEDRRNVVHDSRTFGVQVILLVEDRVRQYSSFLPAMYTTLLQHSQRVITEGLNLSQKILRMRARPKILLCTTWEEAEAAFEAYKDEILGIVSDVEFPRAGVKSPTAGAEFTRQVREVHPDIPVILHSSQPDNEELARRLGVNFLLKGSPFLLENLGKVMLEDFGFGDFVFRRPDGTEVGRASDLKTLERSIATVPDDSLEYHATRNHFSRWLKSRTVFDVAYALRPRRPQDFGTTAAMREHLLSSIVAHRREQAQLFVADFDRERFDFSSDFYRVGGGSLGGKARGLAFVRRLLVDRGLSRRFPGVGVGVPAAVVVGTDVFDRFLAENDLRRFATECDDDAELMRRFVAAKFPEETERDLAAFLAQARFPLAIRSSSLLEDSVHQPFTGVYDTLMLANEEAMAEERLRRVLIAIRRVYASTFSRAAKVYLEATTHRLEEEKMAVILQRIVGARHGERFYPTFSGVARSHNFYPREPMRAEDGIAAVALGLGRTIVEGGACLRFCPRYPKGVPQLATAREALATTQRGFWALPLGPGESESESMRERLYPLEAAEADGELSPVASTYSRENDALYEGVARPGTRVVTFAPILRHGRPPLAELLSGLLEEGARGMGAAVEIEFACQVDAAHRERGELSLLQMRPLGLAVGSEPLEIGEVAREDLVCRSRSVLGNGRVDGLRHVVVVDLESFDRARSRETATAVARMNGRLLAARIPYLLVGVGRWGSRDPWLGIPVTWDQVCGARVIVEAGLRDVAVTPSQGSHFFQNLTSFNVGYFTVDDAESKGFVDWRWLRDQAALDEAGLVRLLRFEQPLAVKMDGRRGEGVILKPGVEPTEA